MNIFKRINQINLNFYSDDMYVTREFLMQNHLKLTYQRQSISNLDLKHKEWSKYYEI